MHWYEVVKRIFVVLLLARQNLAFRGVSHKLHEHNNGNFLKTINMITRFDATMFEHVRRIQFSKDAEKYTPTYLGNKIQNEIGNLLSVK